ncbi:hypothetical protein MUK42_35843 [Musa troglodytarum]|uniref:Uncharacterized protein n=1 Tax=Musa troglodytarum TaxID=320322 RepID=A0A9E7FK82_9LILI|nr:hypothetical protein MUK42_35843 [Musa troglodytarum]
MLVTPSFPLERPTPTLHRTAALFHSLTKLESWLHLVSGGRLGTDLKELIHGHLGQLHQIHGRLGVGLVLRPRHPALRATTYPSSNRHHTAFLSDPQPFVDPSLEEACDDGIHIIRDHLPHHPLPSIFAVGGVLDDHLHQQPLQLAGGLQHPHQLVGQARDLGQVLLQHDPEAAVDRHHRGRSGNLMPFPQDRAKQILLDHRQFLCFFCELEKDVAWIVAYSHDHAFAVGRSILQYLSHASIPEGHQLIYPVDGWIHRRRTVIVDKTHPAAQGILADDVRRGECQGDYVLHACDGFLVEALVVVQNLRLCPTLHHSQRAGQEINVVSIAIGLLGVAGDLDQCCQRGAQQVGLDLPRLQISLEEQPREADIVEDGAQEREVEMNVERVAVGPVAYFSGGATGAPPGQGDDGVAKVTHGFRVLAGVDGLQLARSDDL